jgi:hypothetical protein
MRNSFVDQTSRLAGATAKPSHRWLLPSALVIPFLLAACGGAGERPAGAEAADEEPATAGLMASAEGAFQGFALTREEADALRAAHEARGQLSADDVAEVLGVDLAPALDGPGPELAEGPGASSLGRLSLAVRRGEDSSIGDCSVITLIGLDDGRYHFEQFLFGGHSSLFGEIVISTDGLLAIPDVYGVEGTQQIFDDDLFEGIFATATTMSGWMFTSNNSLCFGELFAVWE